MKTMDYGDLVKRTGGSVNSGWQVLGWCVGCVLAVVGFAILAQVLAATIL